MKPSLTITPASLEHFRTGTLIAQSKVDKTVQDTFEGTTRTLFAKILDSTPRRTGALASSGRIAYKHTSTVFQSVISFGDDTINPVHGVATSEYAPVVHEVYNPKHPMSYKWLEKKINAEGATTLTNGLAEAIRAILT